MVTIGNIVKEDCSVESKARLGTVTKVTDIVMHSNSIWQEEVTRWKSYNTRDNTEPDMIMCHIVRPGKVVSVRWQDNIQKETIHVFYDDCEGRSHFNHGSNAVEVVRSTL